MRDDCWLKPATVRTEFKEFFSDTDKQLSTYYEENPNVREEHLEGRLVTLLESTPFTLYENRINRERRKRGLPLLTLKFQHITNREGGHGADIGLVANLNLPGEFVLTKATLIQSKRLHPNRLTFNEQCDYSELFRQEGNARPQWDRMLDITPSSVYFFYNPDRLSIGRTIKTVRTRVINAQVIKGMAEAGRRSFSVEDSLDYGKSFSSWLIDDFICCDVGDSRPETVNLAMNGNPDFTVRHAVHVSIERTDIAPSLFTR